MQVGEYQVLAELARGSAATVYRAHAPQLGRDVALKLAHADADPLRLAATATSLQALDHPRVPAFVADGVHQGRPFLVQELIEGVPLSTRLREQGPLRAGQAAQLLGQLAEVVAYAHEQGVVHGALDDPAHVLLVNGQPHLVGFRGGRPEADDVLQLGTLLQTVLAGSKSIDPDLEELGLACQSGPPEERPSAGEVAAGLQTFLDYGSSEEREWRREQQADNRRLVVTLACVLGVMVVVAAALLAVLLEGRATKREGSEPLAQGGSAAPAPTPTPRPSPSPSPSGAADDLLRRAEELRAAGKLKEALELAERAVSEIPSAEAYLMRGRIQLALGELAPAETDLRRVLAQTPDSLPARQVLAEVLVRSKRWVDARLQLEVILRRTPRDAVAWRRWGRTCLALERLDDALFGLRKSLALAPRSPAGHRELARFYTRAGRHDLAQASLRETLKLKPKAAAQMALLRSAIRAGDVALATQQLGQVGETGGSARALDAALEESRRQLLEASTEWKPKQRRAVITLLQRLVARFPKSWGPAALLGTLQLLQGELNPARTAFQTSVDRDPEQRSAYPLAVTQLLLGEPPKQVLGVLSAAAEADPNNSQRYRLPIAVALCLTGKTEAGWTQGVAFLGRFKPTPQRVLAAATLHSLAGHRVNAVGLLKAKDLERLVETLPEPGQTARVTRILEVMIAGALPSPYPTARVRELLKRYRDDVWVLRWLADTAGQAGHPRALYHEVLARTMELLPTEATIPYRLIGSLLYTRELDRAEAVIKQSRKRWPNELVFLSLHAQVADRRGNLEEATAIYKEAWALERHPMIANNLSLRLGRDPKHLPEAVKMAKFAAKSEKTPGAAAESVAWLLTLSNQLDEARITMRTYLEHNPVSCVGWAHFADLLLRLNEREAGERALAVAEVLADPSSDPVKRREEAEALAGARARLKAAGGR